MISTSPTNNVKRIIQKLERKSTLKTKQKNETNEDDKSTVSDTSAESSVISEESRFKHQTGVKVIKSEIEERIKRSRSNNIYPFAPSSSYSKSHSRSGFFTTDNERYAQPVKKEFRIDPRVMYDIDEDSSNFTERTDPEEGQHSDNDSSSKYASTLNSDRGLKSEASSTFQSMKSMTSFVTNASSFFLTPSVADIILKPSAPVTNVSSIQTIQEEEDNEPQLSPLEISRLYYEAIQYRQEEAFKQLVYLAEEKQNIFAKGFLMRMYVLGQGITATTSVKNISKAQEIAKTIFTNLSELAVIRRSSSSSSSTPSSSSTSSSSSSSSNKLQETTIFANYFLGVCYSEGLAVTKNSKEAIKYYKISAKSGYVPSQAYLGYCLYNGIGIIKNQMEAVKWYRLASNQGYAPSQTNLGICYEYGIEGCLEKDVTKAIELYQRAAEQNDATALFNLGHCYELGIGVIVDIKKAIEYYQASSNLDHIAAHNALAYYYSIGYSSYLSQNIIKSYCLYKIAADKGYAESQCKLGLIYEKGIGIEKNLNEAIRYYRLSANQGNIAAIYYLGYCYFNGLGIKQDYHIAVKLYNKSAIKGYAAAQNNLGFCYFVGIGIKKNYFEAIRWYTSSAEQGYAAAQFNLGYCYEQGFGVPVNKQEMFRCYQLAASQGHSKALTKLRDLKLYK
jgi:TPR repeat protein